MKKKILLSLLIILTLFTITGCGNKNETTNNSNNSSNEIKENSKSVVLYFSATGTTKSIAQRIAKESNSDIIEIIPKEKYKSEDLDYDSDCRANKEQNDSKARPEIKNKIDISKYDTIYLGYPIWWGTNPKIVLTLLDTYNFSGKIIIPFCTSGSTDITTSVNELRNYNSNLDIRDGKKFLIDDSDEVIQEFIDINKSSKSKKTIKAIINEKEYTISLQDNKTANDFVKMLPKKINMIELNNNEKYAYLDSSLPVNETKQRRISAGDLMLYGNNCLVIFYKSFDTSYSYTKIGHIDNLPSLNDGNISIKFEK